ncbi:MAG: dTDP-4-dehydrorhamnose reductase [Vicinamibacterales bacterium]
MDGASRPVLITGAEGQLGRALASSFARRGPVVAVGRGTLDITDHAAVARCLAAERPSVVLNCAAYNDVDAAEGAASAALDVNAMAVRSLARAAADIDACLVHFSTDFVFDGTARVPYTETDAPSPRSVYAQSKLLGEWFAADAPRWFVLRVESLFGAAHWPGVRRVSSVDRIIDAIEAGEPARVFHDRTVSPSYLVDVAAAVMGLLDRDAPGGLYHVVNTGATTWLELGRLIASRLGREDLLVPIAAADLKLSASRPMFAALSNDKLAAAGISMPTWQDAVARYLAHRQSQSRP